MKKDIQYQARELRQQGKSVKEIASSLGVARSSVSVWVRDIELTQEQKLVLHDRRRNYGDLNAGARATVEKSRAKRLAYQENGRLRAKASTPLHLAGCMLYWAEGAKIRNGVYFVNSDPNMMITFVRFLREELAVTNSEIALRIHCHTHDLNEIERIELYWLKLLDLPPSGLRKTYIKEGSSTRHNRLENGVCDIRVHRTDLVQHIFGAIQEYGGFENPDWLF
jgi:transposase-like protein